MSELTINRLSGLVLAFAGLTTVAVSDLHSTIEAGCAACLVGLLMLVFS